MPEKTISTLISLFLVAVMMISVLPLTSAVSESKGSILYVGGSGEGNYTMISDALQSAERNDTIFIYAGTYVEETSLLIEKSIHIQGESADSVSIDIRQDQSAEDRVGFIIRSDEVDISHLSISADTGCDISPTTLTGPILSEVILSDICINGKYGIQLNNTKDCVIVGCMISTEESEEETAFGIMASESSDLAIVQNTIYSGTSMLITDVEGLEVVNNNVMLKKSLCMFVKTKKASIVKNYYEGQVMPGLPKCLWHPGASFLSFRFDWHPAKISNDLPLVMMKTNKGAMILELYEDEMPITTNNFIDLVEIGFFTDIIFHRVIDEFMIQGGGFDLGYTAVDSPFGTIPFESHPEVVHVDGAISMARTNDPDSATSQFFICDGRQKYLDDEYQMETNDQHGYAAFGCLISGWQVLEEISSVETGNHGMYKDWPTDDVILRFASLA